MPQAPWDLSMLYDELKLEMVTLLSRISCFIEFIYLFTKLVGFVVYFYVKFNHIIINLNRNWLVKCILLNEKYQWWYTYSTGGHAIRHVHVQNYISTINKLKSLNKLNYLESRKIVTFTSSQQIFYNDFSSMQRISIISFLFLRFRSNQNQSKVSWVRKNYCCMLLPFFFSRFFLKK